MSVPTVPGASERSSRGRYRAYLAKIKQSGAEAAIPGKDEASTKRARARSAWDLWRAFWGQLRGHHGVVFLSLGTLTLSTLLGMTIPASSKFAIDYVLTDHPGPAGIPDWTGLPRDRVELLLLLGAAMMGVAVLNVGVGMWGRLRMTRLTKLVQAESRRRLFEHVARLPLNRVQALKSGGVSSILRDDANAAGEMIFSVLYNPWRAVIQLVGGLAVLASVDWRLLLGAGALLPVLFLTHRTWIGRIRPVHMAARANRGVTDAHATEVFGGIRVVRAFARRRGEVLRFQQNGALIARQEMLIWWWSRIIDIAWALVIPAASSCVLVYGGWSVLRGRMTIGDVMMFSAYLLMLLGPLEVLTSTATSVQTNLAGFDRTLGLLAEPMEFAGCGRGRALTPARVRGRITLENVSFAYPGSAATVLDGVSLDVPAGQTVALVGASGSGKTTLCNLVARFYDPTSGSVRLDGADLREVDVDSYRALLGIVEQDVFLFDGTVAENIAYARRDAAPEAIRAAADAAHAHEFIERLDRGYATLIGERGVRLSGGQKQRLAIARALLADPKILILDEATSNLDSESEALIQRSLRGLMRGRTCFVIAHRLSTIRHADRIVVLERGRIVESGTHDELIGRSGLYARMLDRQVNPDGAAPVEDLAARP
ncbi:MAG: ABC transporter ATP-binding protein [Phycisphaerae bacterium]|nr:ABC transporter ATP-binding protein [Phycisphaerae bacterium]